MPDSARPTRKNGLSPPYTPAQISTWVLLPFLVLGFLFFVSPILPLAASIPCTILFVLSAIASIYHGYMAMYIDPSDPRLLNANHSNNQNQSGRGNGACENCYVDPEEPTKQCWICDVQVGEKSMHCKFCNKCVDHFDHHCMWLNTCVGKANYSYFFRTMVCILIMLLIQAIIQVFLIVAIYVGIGEVKRRALEWFSVNTTTPVVVGMGIFLLFDLVSISLIGQLLIFHLKLQKEGITTYQFIVRDNKNRRERTKKESDLKLRRKSAIERAKEEGNKCLLFRLENGGFLREKCGLSCFDPLSLDEETTENNNSTDANAQSNGAPY
ncbi:unnamed protein product [Pseudo-nitzschia multistriata]|uniref:Palmitoyltransferase n=1 Tax=Pseudo-nitzschia multistriata TaxID=183589 RepID=A0A448ZFU6_9STRA|nr:unnamed protein product [Pseudo-nitzschia multistriata]